MAPDNPCGHVPAVQRLGRTWHRRLWAIIGVILLGLPTIAEGHLFGGRLEAIDGTEGRSSPCLPKAVQVAQAAPDVEEQTTFLKIGNFLRFESSNLDWKLARAVGAEYRQIRSNWLASHARNNGYSHRLGVAVRLNLLGGNMANVLIRHPRSKWPASLQGRRSEADCFQSRALSYLQRITTQAQGLAGRTPLAIRCEEQGYSERGDDARRYDLDCLPVMPYVLLQATAMMLLAVLSSIGMVLFLIGGRVVGACCFLLARILLVHVALGLAAFGNPLAMFSLMLRGYGDYNAAPRIEQSLSRGHQMDTPHGERDGRKARRALHSGQPKIAQPGT